MTKRAEKPRITLLYCRQCVRGDAELRIKLQQDSEFDLRAEVLPCSSKVRVSQLLKILEPGVDALELVGCPVESCRLLVGSRRAEQRVAYARGLLAEAGVDPERIGMSRGMDLSADDLLVFVRKRAAAMSERKNT